MKLNKAGQFLIFAILLAIFIPDYRFGPDFRLNNKIIDPEISGFDRTKIDFKDYNKYEDLMYVLKTIFPEGTPKSDVENFFSTLKTPHQSQEIPFDESDPTIGSRHSYIFEKLYAYACIGTGHSNKDQFIFTYDKEEKLTGFYLRYFCGLANSSKRPASPKSSGP